MHELIHTLTRGSDDQLDKNLRDLGITPIGKDGKPLPFPTVGTGLVMGKMLSIILSTGTRLSEMPVFRLCNKSFGASLLAVMIVASTVKSSQLNSIRPLRSTRDDVVKLLGKPKIDRPDYSVYQFENERVSFEFSTERCGVGQNAWNVSIGTVTRIWVEPTTQLSLSDVNLQMKDFKKVRDAHVLYVYYLIDEIRGIRYTIDSSSKLVTMIDYYPGLNERKLRCDSNRRPNL